jgi:signal transduction histidine kinase/CheY-like chemotaxis protein/PAS domain-containing protein
MTTADEDDLLRSVAIQNAQSILAARQRAEREILQAKEELERKTRELAHSLAMMRATLDSTWDGIMVTDETGRVTGFNQKLVEMWHIPTERLERRQHGDLIEFFARQFTGTDPASFRARIDDIYDSSPADSLDVLELQDGRVFERYSRVQSVQGRDVGRVWSFRDITQQRRAADALREETRILELLNRTGSVLSSQLDLPALLQTVTDAGTELSGAQFGALFYNAADAKGDTVMLYALSGAPREAFERFGPPQATPLFGPTFRGEGIIRCNDVLQDPRFGKMPPHAGMPDGHLPLRSYLAVPVVSRSGEVIGGLFFGHSEVGVFTERAERLLVGVAAQAAVAIDNTHLYEARKNLLESERSARSEAERASAMKDDFLATVSHELRTPLNSILGWVRILRSRACSEGELSHALEVMERNASMQTQLIEDLLDMSRITSGKMRLDVQPVNPVSFIEAAIETVRPAADAKSIGLRKLLDPTAGTITGDPSRLQQVVWNLLSNAIKFTGRNGRVEIVLRRANSQLEIAVADTGSGIRPEAASLIFERFRQGDSSHTRAVGGLGLGLAIVKHLVEQHGGTVSVVSPGEGQGSTFTIRLPLTGVHMDSSEWERFRIENSQGLTLHFKPSDLSGIRVLVVDDQADARDLIRRILTECEADVTTAGTLDAALAAVEDKRPDVLVSDIGMPDVDGYQLLRRIRALGHARGGALPAIALTAFARSEDRTRALQAGFLMHVSKPVEPAELVAAVARIVGRTGDPVTKA